ncbi:hypothetical protein BKA67DRAFT_543977 [Truncatella angustata]|uniref:Uncharacterized protein n=1 Tax=Truncatella angustata TaxID=152316 RepID=A0A9P8UW52_9PEZI|nr:uncharacterized protein BKA67DRAFT_543977 [Truncatella angustata]KAH6659265.1 hypothetical protein BKA67DRAFT_543977 [Truncatella angustata]KAH8196713.1 hypothetical protein TruAng_009105 [Truncatella angustata]
MSIPPIPLLLSPALPSELLTYILNYHVHPTTVIICSSRTDFVGALQEDIREHKTHQAPAQRVPGSQVLSADKEPQTLSHPELQGQDVAHHGLVSQTLANLAVSRHMRTVYIPTVTHLRSYVTVFSPKDTKIVAPPQVHTALRRTHPTLVVYGVIEMHRDTSEWSAQGLGNTVAALVETTNRLGWGLVMVEPRATRILARDDEDGAPTGRQICDDFKSLLKEQLPILSGSARRAGLDSEEGGWSGRTVEMGRTMSRWFKFQVGNWDNAEDGDQVRT